MLLSTGDATPPCGQPLSVALNRQSSRYPALSMPSTSLRSRLSWIFSPNVDSMTWWSSESKALGDVALDEPVGPVPDLDHLAQRGVAAASGAKPVRAVGELHVVVRVEEQAHHLGEQLVRPARQPQRTPLPIAFRDVGAFDRSPPPPFRTNRSDDVPDLVQGHAIHSLSADPRGHRTRIGVQPLVGQQIQLWVEQLSIQPLQRQAAPAALT